MNINIEYPKDFLKEEVIDGCKVDSQTKKVWLVELDLLNTFIKLCEKHNLRYFVSDGSLIGAVRHNGFIPWDDDIDVMMERNDYEKFIEIAKKELKHPYFIQDEDSDHGYSRGCARLRNSDSTAILKYENNDGIIKYNQGIFIDIFPYDYLPDDLKEREAYLKEVLKLRDKAVSFHRRCIRSNNYTGVKKVINKVLNKVVTSFNIKNKYIDEFNKLAKKYTSGKQVTIMWFADYRHNIIYNKDLFDKLIKHKFEFLEVDIPSRYEEILSQEYGNWREFVRNDNAHGEVIFDPDHSYSQYKF